MLVEIWVGGLGLLRLQAVDRRYRCGRLKSAVSWLGL